MILSWQIPAWAPYQRAALDLYDVERDIAVRQHSKHSVDRNILPRLIVKRDRLIAEVAPLKAAYEAAEREALRRMLAPRMTPAKPATPSTLIDGDDIPAFLRRRAA